MPELLREVKAFYKQHKRNLPWRRTHDPYKILVSEMMLQQTQVERVVPFYKKFIKTFPTARSLAHAPLSQVLRLWQGLGYNRRAKCLHEAAKILAAPQKHLGSGRDEREPYSLRRELLLRADFCERLEELPGVGPYTARAVAVFAYNSPEVFIETNIRTVFLYHLRDVGGVMIYHKKISDAELLPLVAEALKKSHMPPREFYSALMDYGAHLKQRGIKLNHRSKHYVKQSKFEGSMRQLRGAIVRELLKKPKTLFQLTKNLFPRTKEEVKAALHKLRVEGLVIQKGRCFLAGG